LWRRMRGGQDRDLGKDKGRPSKWNSWAW
jgi:hypothetical protein